MSRIRVGYSEPANGMGVFTMTDASAFRTTQDTFCHTTCLVVRAENTFLIAVAEAILHDQWPTIVVEDLHAEETNASGRYDNQSCGGGSRN